MKYILHIDYYDDGDFVHMVYGAETDSPLSKIDIRESVYAKTMQYVHRLKQLKSSEYHPMSDDEKYFDFFGHKVALDNFGIDENVALRLLSIENLGANSKSSYPTFDDFFRNNNFSVETLDSYFASTLPK